MPIKIDHTLCTQCKVCFEVCPLDVFGFDDKNRSIIVSYPEECYYCGACVFDCPIDGAIHLELPLACL